MIQHGQNMILLKVVLLNQVIKGHVATPIAKITFSIPQNNPNLHLRHYRMAGVLQQIIRPRSYLEKRFTPAENKFRILLLTLKIQIRNKSMFLEVTHEVI